MLTRSEIWTAREGERGALLSAAMKTDFNNEGDHSSWVLLGLLEEVAELKREGSDGTVVIFHLSHRVAEVGGHDFGGMPTRNIQSYIMGEWSGPTRREVTWRIS